MSAYYANCTYRLCEYSAGVKLMWREHWHPEYAETNGCLVVLNHSPHHGPLFDYPVPLPNEGTWTRRWTRSTPGASGRG